MTPRQFFDKVVEMREAQKEYFDTRDREVLTKAKNLEKEIDAEIHRVQLILKSKETLGKAGLI